MARASPPSGLLQATQVRKSLAQECAQGWTSLKFLTGPFTGLLGNENFQD